MSTKYISTHAMYSEKYEGYKYYGGGAGLQYWIEAVFPPTKSQKLNNIDLTRQLLDVKVEIESYNHYLFNHITSGMLTPFMTIQCLYKCTKIIPYFQ